MYSSTTSYSIADLGRAPSVQRGQRSLHGSQSHANLLFGSSTNPNFSESMGPGPGMQTSNQQQQQYMPGYLLAASQGQVPPAQVRDFSMAPLESERTLKRGTLAYSKAFGEESLLSAPRPSPKGRSPRTPVSMDDENAPPTMSISESQYGFQDAQQPRLSQRHSIGGFHPLRESHGPFTPGSSLSTTYENPTPLRNADVEMAPDGVGYGVIIFGFTPQEREQALSSFLVEGSSLVEEEDTSMEKQMARNWATIVYQNQWDAARAVRRSGTVALLDGNVLIGAKWADPSQEPPNFAMPVDGPKSARQGSFPTSATAPGSTPTTAQPGLTGPSSARSVRLKPSSSAFKTHTIATANPTRRLGMPSADEWGMAEHAKTLEASEGAPAAPQRPGLLTSLSSTVFGWGS